MRDLIPLIFEVIEKDKVKYKRHDSFFESPISEIKYGLKCLSDNSKYRKRYKDFLEPLVYAPEVVSWFDTIDNITSIFKLVEANS